MTKIHFADVTTGILEARTKHIDVCYYNRQDLYARKTVDYSYMHTNDNVVHILTTALTKDNYEKFTNVMQLWQWRSIEGWI